MAPHLPDEILINIAKACNDEPFSLIITEQRTAQSNDHNSVTDLRVTGPPRLLELQLVNRIFYDEITSATRVMFDGTMNTICRANYTTQDAQRRMVDFLQTTNLSHLLKQVSKIHLDGTDMKIPQIIHAIDSPRLRTIAVDWPVCLCKKFGLDDAMSGKADAATKSAIKRHLLERPPILCGANAFKDFGMLSRRPSQHPKPLVHSTAP